VCLGQFRSTRDFAAGVRCLIPAAPAIPAAAAKQQNDKYDDEKRGGIHVELLLAVPCMFSHFAYPLPLQPTLLIPIRSRYWPFHPTRPLRHHYVYLNIVLIACQNDGPSRCGCSTVGAD
jgi:hypothetical protein